jgi:hypothetical protein
MRQCNRHRLGLLGIVALLVFAGTAIAQTPQTIVIDGVNDFLPGNMIDADFEDVNVPDHVKLDIANLHVTNDAVNLYVGFNKDAAPFGSSQLGIAIDVDGAPGGTTDPWGRQLEWSLAASKPDFMFYINLDNNWQAAYSWDGAAWVGMGSAGPGALNWQAQSTDFAELGIMLGNLGVSPGSVIGIEGWLTQDSPNKGPLDNFANDPVQLSLPGLTLWDTPSPISMTAFHPFTVQAAADPDPPVVNKVEPAALPVDSFFDVYFNEPVDPTTAEVAGNYTFTGANVLGALVDGGDPSIVRLELDSVLGASASLYQVTVTNVEDVAGNPIVENGVDNFACVGLKNVVFRGKMGPFLDNQGGTPPYIFTIEGSKAPLTFGILCDNAEMTDTGGDIYEWSTVMSYAGDCGAGTASESFEWKFAYDCTTYEPLGSNRTHTLDIANGATDVLEFWWNDEDPTQFTQHDIDVEFFVDMNATAWAPGDSVSIGGSVLPLNFDTPPTNQLVDDGSGNDAVPGDGIWSTVITFPTGSKKDVNYKFLLNSEFECEGQGDRNLYLNDEEYDTVGGALGPLTMPVGRYDFCNALWRAVEVVFSVDMSTTSWDVIQPTDVVSVNGTENNAEPPTFDWTVPSLNNLADDGVWPDAAAGDRIYTVAVVFPDTSAQFIEYKYLFNDVYECFDSGNHTFHIDPDTYDAVGNPQILPLDVFNPCGISTVPQVATGMRLAQNTPNPFNPSTEIKYSVVKGGQGALRVYNIRGEVVRTLREGTFPVGAGSVVWDGKSDSGRQAGSGVYFYRLDVAGQVLTKRMVLLK